MNPIGITITSVAFWVFLSVVSVTAILQDYRKRKLGLETVRAAIERGQQLSPELIDRLLGRNEESEQVNPQHLHIGGIITCAAGVGVAVLSLFMALVLPPVVHWIVLGAGALTFCVGVGLLMAAKSLRR